VKLAAGVVLLVMAFAAAYALAAQAPADTFTVYGAGAAPCSSWTEHLSDKALHAQDVQWVLGFASAAGVFAGVQVKGEPDAIDPFLTKYCQEHPTSTITTAAANMVGNLR
jgi:hypothetical protein